MLVEWAQMEINQKDKLYRDKVEFTCLTSFLTVTPSTIDILTSMISTGTAPWYSMIVSCSTCCILQTFVGEGEDTVLIGVSLTWRRNVTEGPSTHHDDHDQEHK